MPAATGISGGPAEGGGLPTAGRRASSRGWPVVSPPCISWTQPQAWHPGWGSGETAGAGAGAGDAGWSRGTTAGSALFVSWAAWPNPQASGPSSLAPPGHLPCELRADPTPPGPRAVASCSALRLAPRPGPLLPDALHWTWVAHSDGALASCDTPVASHRGVHLPSLLGSEKETGLRGKSPPRCPGRGDPSRSGHPAVRGPCRQGTPSLPRGLRGGPTFAGAVSEPLPEAGAGPRETCRRARARGSSG